MRKRSIAMSFFCKLVLLGAVAQCAFVVSAKTIYVAPSGDDNNAGTSDAPVATIKKGVSLATQDGDIVQLMPGNHTLGSQVKVTKAISFVGDPADCSQVVVDCGKILQSFYNDTVDGWSFSGITLTNLNRAVYTTKLTTIDHCAFRHGSGSTAGMALCFNTGTTGDGFFIEDCEFEDLASGGSNGKGAVYVASTSTFSLTFRRCVFRDCSGTNNGGAIGQNSNGGFLLTAENCEFRNCKASVGGAIALQTNNGKTSVFRNCLFDGCSMTSSSNGGSAIFTYSNILCENCTFADNGCPSCSANSAAAIYNKGGSASLANCIFWNNKDKNGVEREIYPTTPASAQNCAAPTTLADGNGNVALSASPFAGDGVYTLAETVGGNPNPCIDGGVTLDWMEGATDLAGVARVFNDVPDIGAYEYGATVSNAGFLMYIDVR